MRIFQILFLQFLKVFSGIDDTEELKKMGIEAAPDLYGFSIEKGLEKFPNFYYQPCKEKYAILPTDSISINHTNNTLEMSCSMSYAPYVILASDTKVQLSKPKDIKLHTKKIEYSNSFQIEPWHEYALGSCYGQINKGVHLRYLSPINKNKKYLARLKSQKKTREKPMIILFITVDSFSRRHFYRKLTKTLEFFQELQNYTTFDYKLHNIIGADTAENQIHVFGKPDLLQNFEDFDDNLGNSAIWSKMKENGFMTLWGTDGCATNVPKALGNKPSIDHIVSTFFCANKLYSEYTADKQHKYEQRCLGTQMSHYYLMNYTLKFSENYRNASQWIYNHFTAAHEASGQHAQTLDQDLVDYMGKYIENYGKTHEVVIFLNGDHGMRYGGYMLSPESIQEFRLPACFITARTEFLDKIHANIPLLHNSYRLTSKPDLRKSMFYLSDYQTFKWTSTDDKSSVNLFSELIPNNRSCKDAKIPLWYCSTYLPTLIFNSASQLNFTNFNDLLIKLQEYTLYEINAEVYTPKHTLSGLCQKLHKGEIYEASISTITKGEILVKFVFGVNEFSEARFHCWVFLSTYRFPHASKVKDINHSSGQIFYNSTKFNTKVIFI